MVSLVQDREPYRIPRRVQDVIPIQCVWPDGIFKVGIKFSKTYRFTDINYKVASREDKETMFLAYSELLNGLDSAATTKLTICNRRQSLRVLMLLIMALVFLLFPLFHAGLQKVVVQRGRFKAQFPGSWPTRSC